MKILLAASDDAFRPTPGLEVGTYANSGVSTFGKARDFNFCVRCTILRGSTFRKEKQIKKTVWKKEDFHMMDKIYVAYNFQQITNVFFQAINK